MTRIDDNIPAMGQHDHQLYCLHGTEFMRINNKTALITGGGSGLGEASSLRLAEEGARVFVTDISQESAERVAQTIRDFGGQATALHHDVTQESDWSRVHDAIAAECQSLDILVNNAGVAFSGNIEETTLSDWRAVNSVNSDGVFLGMKNCLPIMTKPGGSIINISSIEGIIGDPKLIAYNASKGAVRLMTKSAALHCTQAGYGVRVNSIHPGFIETPMVAEGVAAMGDAAEEFHQRILAAIPMGHLGQAIDIANAVLFLASDESRYMTGSEMVIDGGYTAH